MERPDFNLRWYSTREVIPLERLRKAVIYNNGIPARMIIPTFPWETLQQAKHLSGPPGVQVLEVCYRKWLRGHNKKKLLLAPKFFVSGYMRDAMSPYEKGRVLAKAVPMRLVSFGTTSITHPARLASIYLQTGAAEGSLIGNTGKAHRVECTQRGIDPPFFLRISRDWFHAPEPVPPHFGDLTFDLHDVQRAAIRGLHLDYVGQNAL